MREASAELKAHLEGAATTTCRLLKITLSTDIQDSSHDFEFGFTSLDKDIEYEGLVYKASQGFDPSVVATNLGLSVDNAEGKILAAEADGITKEMVEAGILDDATWVMMLVNFKDLTMGHMIIDAGDVGEVRIVDDVVFMPELLSISMRLRQPIGHVWQKTCRAIFASGTEDSSGIVEGQTSCGVDDSGMWTTGTVTGVDTVGDSAGEAEPHRVFADDTLTGSAQLENVTPGRLQWLSGENASSKLYQVESYDPETGAIALLETTPYQIQIGDIFQIRPDCAKTVEACKAYSNFINFKGEPHIPVADGTEATTPYAQI